MKEKPKKVLLSLGMIATVVSPVATVIACSKTVEVLTPDDLSGLVDETALASDITKDDVIALLGEMGVEVTPEEIDLESDDAAGTLTVTITYTDENDEQQTNVIELTGFKIDAGEEETNPDEAVAEDSTSVADLTPGEFSDFVNASKLPSEVTPEEIVDYLKGIGVEVTTDDVAVEGDDAAGTLTVTITYTDENDEQQTSVIKLTGFKIDAGDEEDEDSEVIDEQGPSIGLVENYSLGGGESITGDANNGFVLTLEASTLTTPVEVEQVFEAVDDTDGLVGINFDWDGAAAPAKFAAGTTYNVTLTATDAAGNQTTVDLVITVEEEEYTTQKLIDEHLVNITEVNIATSPDDTNDDKVINDVIEAIKNEIKYDTLTDEQKAIFDAFINLSNGTVNSEGNGGNKSYSVNFTSDNSSETWSVNIVTG